MRILKPVSLLALSLLFVACQNTPSSSDSNSNNTSINSTLSTSSEEQSSSFSSSSSSISSSSSSQVTTSIDETKVTNVKFIIKTINLKVNEKQMLEWKIYPSTAVNKNVTFNVEDESICAVSESGELEAKSIGSTKITITTVDGGFIDDATVNVVGNEATSLKLIVPEDTLKSEKGVYYIEVGKEIQLSYIMDPSDAYNKISFSTKSGNSSAESYLSVSETGLLKAIAPKTNITVSVTSDNLLADTVKFAVLTSEKYTQEFITSKAINSLALEQQQVISGKREESIKTTGRNETTVEDYNIYTNGAEYVTSLTDNDLNKTTISHSFEGIKDNEYYFLSRNSDNKYSITSLKKAIGEGENQITLEEATKRASLAHYKSYYGVSQILKDYIINSTSYFGATSKWLQYNLNSSAELEATTYILTGSYENLSTYWAVPSLYKQLTLSFTINNDGLILGFDFTSLSYDSSYYDFEKHELKENAKTKEEYSLKFTQEVGTRSTKDNLNIDPETCYYTSFNVNTYLFEDDGYTTTFTIGDYIKYDVIDYLPSTATQIIDQINFVSSSDNNVAAYSTAGGLKAVGEGDATLTFASSRGVEATIDIHVNAGVPESISFVGIDVPGIKVNESIDSIKALVSPASAKNLYTIQIDEGSEHASLSYNQETNSYSLLGTSIGKVVLKAVSTENNEIFATKTIYVYQDILETEVLDTLLAHPYKAISEYGREYVLHFLSDGKGRITDDNDLLVTTYGSFNYSVDGYTITVTSSQSIVSYFYSLDGNLQANPDGLQIVGELRRGSTYYEKETLTFVRCD